MNCKKCGADPLDGVLSCGSIYYESDNWTHESRQCLRRQLAAANERAEKADAQLAELREGWPSFEYVDDTEGMVAIEVPEVVIQNFHRILGGA